MTRERDVKLGDIDDVNVDEPRRRPAGEERPPVVVAAGAAMVAVAVSGRRRAVRHRPGTVAVPVAGLFLLWYWLSCWR